LNGFTQEILAEGICSVSQLSKLENGQTYAQRTLLKQFAERLEVNIEKLESSDGLSEELKEKMQIAKYALDIKKYQESLGIIQEVIGVTTAR
jgi:HTH-type transcriptional regulator, quorum sensing regulator NprR